MGSPKCMLGVVQRTRNYLEFGKVSLEDLRARRIADSSMALVDHQEADVGQTHVAAVQGAKEACVGKNQDLKARQQNKRPIAPKPLGQFHIYIEVMVAGSKLKNSKLAGHCATLRLNN